MGGRNTFPRGEGAPVRKLGRMRNGDALGQEMHPNKTDKGFDFVIIYELLLNVSDFAVPHPTRLTPGHLPPGGRYLLL